MHKNYLINLPKWPNKLVILDIGMFWKHIGKYAWLVQRTLVISWIETAINYLVPKYTELSKLTVSNAKSSIFTQATQWTGRRTQSFVPTGMVIQTQLVPEHVVSPFQSFTTHKEHPSYSVWLVLTRTDFTCGLTTHKYSICSTNSEIGCQSSFHKKE